MSKSTNNTSIGDKIHKLRLEHGLSQQQLAAALGWNHHQTVSEVEQGHREIKALELSKLTQFFSRPLNYFLDKNDVEKQRIIAHGHGFREQHFLEKCANFIYLEELVYGKRRSLPLPKLNLLLNKWNENDAYQLGTEIRRLLDLGAFPACGLITALEENVNVKFIHEKASDGPTSACSRYDDHCFIWINKAYAHNGIQFTIAHELFHLITFDSALLESIKIDSKYNDKNELLADAFAAGLLVPEEQLRLEVSRFNHRLLLSDVVVIASLFHVAPKVLLHRLHNLKLISKPLMEEYLLKTRKYQGIHETSINLNRKYHSLIYLALQHDKITRSQASKMVDSPAADLKKLFYDFGFPL